MSTELIFVIVFSTLLILDIVGNTLVILVILKHRSMKTPMNYLLLNLAVADIMVGAFLTPTFLIFTERRFRHPTGTMGDVLCKTVTGSNLAWISSLVSGFTLVCVAVERFYAVVHPLSSIRRKITKRKLRRMVAVCWIIATAHTIPDLLCKSVYVSDSGRARCRTFFKAHWQYVTYDIFWLVSIGIVPVFLMTVLYSRVVYTLWLKDDDATRLAVIRARKRITQKTVTVSVIYALCVLPLNVLFLVLRFYPKLFIHDDIFFRIGYCLLLLNSSVNPFVYTFQCEKFRKYLKRLICNA